MKLQNLNLGKSLTKEQQKQIKGGESICQVGTVALCYCNDPAWVMCVPGDGHGTPATLCASTNACGPHGGLNHDSGSCKATCPPPGNPS